MDKIVRPDFLKVCSAADGIEANKFKNRRQCGIKVLIGKEKVIMKTAVIYYSFGGSCKKEAERLAEGTDADVFRIKEKKERSVANSVMPGCPQAVGRKKTEIIAPAIDFNLYDKVVIGCPVWAGFPAPAFNAIADLIPAGKPVELFFCSASGRTNKSEEGTKKLLEKKGCSVISLRNIKTGIGIVKEKT
jgi:flavodoxin